MKGIYLALEKRRTLELGEILSMTETSRGSWVTNAKVPGCQEQNESECDCPGAKQVLKERWKSYSALGLGIRGVKEINVVKIKAFPSKVGVLKVYPKTDTLFLCPGSIQVRCSLLNLDRKLYF